MSFLGSEEGFAQADKAINTASKNGKWVLLKNVHLAPSWLVSLEKKIHSLSVHPGFRLFLTCEITPKLPVNLLRAGRIFTFEPPPGVKANLIRTFATIPASRMMRAPNERARLYFLLAWFHAIVQERLRYRYEVFDILLLSTSVCRNFKRGYVQMGTMNGTLVLAIYLLSDF